MLIVHTFLIMVAFAANSVLNRLALTDGGMDAELFGVLRLASGAVMLLILLTLQGRGIAFGGWRMVWPVLALLTFFLASKMKA